MDNKNKLSYSGGNMKIVKIISLIGLIVMTAGIGNAMINGDFATDGALILQNPWGVVSLIDLYTGFVLFSSWIVYREKAIPAKIIWVALMMVLGFWTASLYMFIASLRAQGDWEKFWMGTQYKNKGHLSHAARPTNPV